MIFLIFSQVSNLPVPIPQPWSNNPLVMIGVGLALAVMLVWDRYQIAGRTSRAMVVARAENERIIELYERRQKEDVAALVSWKEDRDREIERVRAEAEVRIRQQARHYDRQIAEQREQIERHEARIAYLERELNEWNSGRRPTPRPINGPDAISS